MPKARRGRKTTLFNHTLNGARVPETQLPFGPQS
jgi:hypothetical protein